MTVAATIGRPERCTLGRQQHDLALRQRQDPHDRSERRTGRPIDGGLPGELDELSLGRASGQPDRRQGRRAVGMGEVFGPIGRRLLAMVEEDAVDRRRRCAGHEQAEATRPVAPRSQST